MARLSIRLTTATSIHLCAVCSSGCVMCSAAAAVTRCRSTCTRIGSRPPALATSELWTDLLSVSMAALGQKQTCAVQSGERTCGCLFDQLVGKLLETQRHVEAQFLDGLEIDEQLKLCRHLHWKVGRLLALEDAVDIPCRQTKLFAANVTIRNQAAQFRKKAIVIDRWHSVAER